MLPSGSRLQPNTGTTESFSIKIGADYRKKISKLATMCVKASNLPDERSDPRVVPPLSELAIKRLVRTSPVGIIWATFILNILALISKTNANENVHNTLNRETLKQLKFNKCPSFIFDIASERVKKGESCHIVITEHEISIFDKAWNELQMIAVKGLAGELVHLGVPCQNVAEKYGISSLSEEAWEELQMIAVKGQAGELVRQGASSRDIAIKHGISFYSEEAWNELRMIEVNRQTAKRVRKGKH